MRPDYQLEMEILRYKFKLVLFYDTVILVAIEARPDFVAETRCKFKSYIDSGLLEIVHCAAAETEGSMPFYIFPEKDDWGTLDRRYAERNVARGKGYNMVDVPTVKFDSVLRRFGLPYYLKIDIEGTDMLCVRAIHAFADRPTYLSMVLTLQASSRSSIP